MSDEAVKVGEAGDARVAALEAQIEELTRRVLKAEARLDPLDPPAVPVRPMPGKDYMANVARIPDEAVRRMAEAVPTDLIRAIVRDNRGW
jgi:hypothetical protein